MCDSRHHLLLAAAAVIATTVSANDFAIDRFRVIETLLDEQLEVPTMNSKLIQDGIMSGFLFNDSTEELDIVVSQARAMKPAPSAQSPFPLQPALTPSFPSLCHIASPFLPCIFLCYPPSPFISGWLYFALCFIC